MLAQMAQPVHDRQVHLDVQSWVFRMQNSLHVAEVGDGDGWLLGGSGGGGVGGGGVGGGSAGHSNAAQAVQPLQSRHGHLEIQGCGLYWQYWKQGNAGDGAGGRVGRGAGGGGAGGSAGPPAPSRSRLGGGEEREQSSPA